MSRPVLEPRTTSKVTSNTNSRPSSPLRYGNCPNIERKFKVFKPQNLDYVYIYECSYVYIYVPKVRCLCCNRDFRSVPINMKVSCLCYNRDFLAGLLNVAMYICVGWFSGKMLRPLTTQQRVRSLRDTFVNKRLSGL